MHKIPWSGTSQKMVAGPSEMRRVIATRSSLGLFENGDTPKRNELAILIYSTIISPFFLQQ